VTILIWERPEKSVMACRSVTQPVLTSLGWVIPHENAFICKTTESQLVINCAMLQVQFSNNYIRSHLFQLNLFN